jgi:MFS family permease
MGTSPYLWIHRDEEILTVAATAEIAASTTPVRIDRAANIVFASTVGTALGVTPAVTAVFGVFLVSIAGEFHWPRAEVSGALAAVSIATMLASPLAGWIGDKIGSRRTLLCGSLLLGLSVLSLSLARPSPVLFYLQFILVGVAGALPSGMIYAKLIAEWFETRRGLWIGIAGGVGNGLGATVLPLLAGALLPLVGWRGAFATIALLILLVGLPVQFFLIRDAPLSRGPHESDATGGSFEGLDLPSALRTPTFWLLVTSLAVGGGCLIGLFSMIVPIVTERGFSVEMATGVIALWSLVCTVWEPSVGYILDRSTRPRVLAVFYWIAAAGLVVLLNAPSMPLLLLSAVMLALGLGAECSALSFLLSRYLGRRALGGISGIAFAVLLGATALTMVLLNVAYDAGIGYRIPVLWMMPLFLWNGVALLFLGPYPFRGGTVDAGAGALIDPESRILEPSRS